MLLQKKLIEIVRKKCEVDPMISAGMMYGSFTKYEGDQYSDIEFYIFLKKEEINHFNSSKWIKEIAPYDLLFFNEYGTEVVIFSNLIRGEFHFLSESKMEIIKSFKSTGVFPDTESMFIYDKTNKLKGYLDYLKGEGPNRMTNENVDFAFNNFVNAWLMGINVFNRGEFARSLDCLTGVQQYLLRLIRVKEKSVERWLNSTKNLEADISQEAYNDFALTSSSLNAFHLNEAYLNALLLCEKLVKALRSQYEFELDQSLIDRLRKYIKN